MAYDKKEYNKEYNKNNYKVIKVYIPKEEYPQIEEKKEKKGYKYMSEYIKALIDTDIQGGAYGSIHIEKGINNIDKNNE